jgi:hypothetical protein
MSWLAKRAQVVERLNELATQNPTAVEPLELKKQAMERLDTSLTEYLSAAAQNYQMSDKLEQTGQLQQHIQRLEEVQEKMKTDVETAVARAERLRNRDRTGNEHTLYLLNRPVRHGMVPFLWVLSVLFVGIGVYLFYQLAPFLLGMNSVTSMTSVSYGIGQVFEEIFYSRFTWMALFGAASIVILALSLKIAGVFGK